MDTARLRSVGETDFQRWVVAEGRKNGWRVRVMDQRNSRGVLHAQHEDQRGWPDLVIVKDRVVWMELKPFGGKLRPTQEQCLSDLRVAGAEVYVVTPAHRIAIEAFLAGDKEALR